jgi:hypothetical protein
MARKKKKKDNIYEPPEVVGDVEALPPPRRLNKGQSVYDDAILAGVEKEGRWVKVDPMGRTQQAFRNALNKRLEVLELEMKVAQRGKFIYVKFDGEAEGVAEMIERVRAETRALYGE